MKKIKRLKKEDFQIPTSRWVYYPQIKQGYLTIKNGEISYTTPLIEGKVFVDKNKEGEILGVEILL